MVRFLRFLWFVPARFRISPGEMVVLWDDRMGIDSPVLGKWVDVLSIGFAFWFSISDAKSDQQE